MAVEGAFFPMRGQWSMQQGYFMMPFISYSTNSMNTGGGGFICQRPNNDVVYVPNGAGSTYSPCYNLSYRVVWTSSNYSSYISLLKPYDGVIPPVSDVSSNGSILVFPTKLEDGVRKVIMNKPFFVDSSENMSSMTYISAFPYLDLPDVDSSSTPDLTIPILMIPSTILVVCFFSIIYRMFMNRKVRG